MKRMYIELTKLTSKQLASLRRDINVELAGRASKIAREQNPEVRAQIPMQKCVVIDGSKKGTPYFLGYTERKPQ